MTTTATALQAHGGAIPSVRLLPLIEEYERRNPIVSDDLLTRQFYKIRHEQEHVSFDLADRMLIRMGIVHEWHGELADLYETGEPQPLRKTPGTAPRLSDNQIRSAWTLYERGLSMNDLGRLLWKRCGFPSPKACTAAFVRAFKYRPTRSTREASFNRYRKTGCAGCGCEISKRTYACRKCAIRHHARKKRGQPYVAVGCRGCGISLAELNPDCVTCLDRRAGRLKRAASSSPATRTAAGGGTPSLERSAA